MSHETSLRALSYEYELLQTTGHKLRDMIRDVLGELQAKR
jgi:hypothetical protein